MVTIKQIAQELGISVSTVSIVLGGKGAERKISPATQQRILDKATEMGYRPNIAARSLRGGTGAEELQIAVFWAQDFRASMMVRFWDGLRKAVERQQRPIRLVIYPYNNDHLREMRALTSANDCHAAIICNASYADLEFVADTKLSVPVVLYNRFCPGYASVNVDDARMGAMAARALMDNGCKTVEVLTGPPLFEGMEVRVQGFALEIVHHGLTRPATHYCENSVQGGYDAARRRLTGDWKNKLPDGIFCGSSFIAHGVRRAFWESGLSLDKFPKLVAIGNGTESFDRFAVPSLSVIRLPMEEMAAECLYMLLDFVNQKIARPESRLMETDYIPRESCGPFSRKKDINN